jgi:hypothetical protein
MTVPNPLGRSYLSIIHPTVNLLQVQPVHQFACFIGYVLLRPHPPPLPFPATSPPSTQEPEMARGRGQVDHERG